MSKPKEKKFNPIGYNPVTAPLGYTDEEMAKASRSNLREVSIRKT